MSSKIRWGIVTAGKISHDFVVALSTLPNDEHLVVCVAARDQEKASQFAKRHNIEKAYRSYKELAESQDIDIAYVGALNPQHFEIAMMLLENGKHVLCEKPLCLNYRQTKKLIQYAEQKRLFLMEGVWSRFFPTYQYLRKQIDNGILGEIQEVDITFGFDLTQVDRLQQKDLGGGVILDLGIYTIQCSQWAFQEPPKEIIAKGELNSDGVDIDVKAELCYSGGRKAKIHCSAKEKLPNEATIKGTKGQITLINFWCPTKLIDIDGKEKEWVLPRGSHPTNFPNSEGFRYEAESVRQCLLEGRLQNDIVTHNDSLLFAQIEDEMRKQIGVRFDADN